MTVPIRVVVADDSADIRRMLRLSLDLEGDFEVVAEAADGQEAVDVVERERPDAVVLDLAMPVMDGLQAITHIRERSPLTRIVVLSGFNATQMAGKARALGADAYLEKGTAFADVAGLLRSLHTRDQAVEAVPEPAPAAAEPAPASPNAARTGVAATGRQSSLAARIAGAPDLDTAFGLFAGAVQEIVAFDRAAFSVVTDDGKHCEVLATAGPSAWRLPVGSSLTLDGEGLDLLGRGGPWVVTDTAARTDLVAVAELCQRGLRSFVSVPIVVGGRLRVLVSFGSVREGAFGREEVAAIEEAVEPVGGVLHVLALLDEERETTRRMRDLDRLRSDFIGMVVHDLRAPMTVIAGFTEGLERGWEVLDDEQKREFIGRIRRNVTNLTDLVEDVLTVSHIESREFHLDIRPLDLGSHLRQCVWELAESVPERPVVAEIPDDLPPVYGDALRQRQVISNLVGNALKFSPADEPVVVSAREIDSAIEVRVEDHGIGIADDDLPHLFERFYRTDEGKSRDRSGTGLGLFICKSLVESWGGRIEVESRLGAGSTFVYTTPLADAGALAADGRGGAETSDHLSGVRR